MLSTTTSLHQQVIQKIKNKKPKNNKNPPLSHECKYITVPKSHINTAIDVQSGQGLELTKWNECSVLFFFKVGKSKYNAFKVVEKLRLIFN